MATIGCGIDIGGSGVKGALVDLDTGEFIGERIRIATPQPATPEAVAEVCSRIIEGLNVPEDVAVGISFPAPIVHGVVPSAKIGRASCRERCRSRWSPYH